MKIINLAFYKFVELIELPALKKELLGLCQRLELKGTILLSREGINCCIAGAQDSVDQLRKELDARQEFSNLPYKESVSDYQPFTRMLVKIKKEIIAFGVESVNPAKVRAPSISPAQFKQWMDEKRDLVILDTRNDYEIKIGTFEKAIDLNIRYFRDFPERAKSLPDSLKEKTVVTFCTGGIRCEKAAPLLQQYGFKDIYQLDGGILKYLEECGDSHYQGECFVFDYRVSLNAKLEETETAYCQGCQFPVTAEEQKLPQYIPGSSCPNCAIPNSQTSA